MSSLRRFTQHILPRGFVSYPPVRIPDEHPARDKPRARLVRQLLDVQLKLQSAPVCPSQNDDPAVWRCPACNGEMQYRPESVCNPVGTHVPVRTVRQLVDRGPSIFPQNPRAPRARQCIRVSQIRQRRSARCRPTQIAAFAHLPRNRATSKPTPIDYLRAGGAHRSDCRPKPQKNRLRLHSAARRTSDFLQVASTSKLPSTRIIHARRRFHSLRGSPDRALTTYRE